MKVERVELESQNVRLVVLKAEHLDDLWTAGADQRIWRWFPFRVKNFKDMENYVAAALENLSAGRELPFVIIEKSARRVIGSTRFMNIDIKNKRAEIGSTWIDPQWQRTSVNTEAKLLLLGHGFETWECIRIELKTDALNEKSRRAILRIGAQEEGVLRQHMITGTGRLRDSVYYSIIDAEWPQVKAALIKKLRSY